MSDKPNKPGPGGELRVCLGATAVLLVLFLLGIAIAPGLIRGIFSRNIYNYRLIARRELERGNPDAAVAVLERAAKEIPREVYFERPEFMYDWIGRIRKEQGRTTDSLAAFLRSQRGYFRNIRLSGYLPPPRLIGDIVEVYFESGNYSGAYNEARVAMDFYPTRCESHLAYHQKRVPNDPRILRDLGLLELKANIIANARENLTRSLAGNRATPESRYWLGRIEESQRRPDNAIREYEAELRAYPYNANAVARLAVLYKERGRRDIATQPAREKARSALIASFHAGDSSGLLARLLGINASVEYEFSLDRAGTVLVNITAHSTPFEGIYGWIEIALDGRHVQTLYIDGDGWGKDGDKPHTYSIRFERLGAGSHTLRLTNLSDGMDETADRNTFLHGLRIYREP